MFIFKDNFTREEHESNLSRLSIDKYTDLINKDVYYVKKSYGKHKVLLWDDECGEYLLKIDDHEFWTNPFKLHRC